MGDESYLLYLDKEIALREKTLGGMDEKIEEGRKELNDLSTKLSTVSDDYKKAARREAAFFEEEVKVAQVKRDKFLRENKELMESLPKKEKELVRWEEDVSTREKGLVAWEFRLQAKEKRLNLDIEAAVDNLETATLFKKQATEDRAFAADLKVEASKVLASLRKKQVELSTKLEEECKVLVEEKEQAIKAKEEMGLAKTKYEEGLSDLKKENKRIASAWEDILSTKKLLDDRRKKGSK